MAKPKKKNEESAQVPVENVLIHKITEYSPHGFVLIYFDSYGEVQYIKQSDSAIVSLALDKALERVVKENEIIEEQSVIDKLMGEDGPEN